MPESDPAAAARERLLASEADTIDAVLRAATAIATDTEGEVADGWFRLDDGRPATTEREAVVSRLRAALDGAGLLHDLTTLLATAVDAAGYELAARPVPAPPYVVVTSTGPVLRATVEDGRLVVALDCFEVVRGVEAAGENEVAYVHMNTDPATALTVSFAR